MILESVRSNTEILNSFTKEELKIFSYVHDNTEDVCHLSCSQLAEKIYCSTTTINRFCKKIGVNGFTEFKAILNYEKKYKYNTTTNKFLNFEVNMSDLIKFEQALNKECKFYIIATGFSEIPATYLYKHLLSLNYNVFIVEDTFIFKTLEDIELIIVSNSGECSNLLKELSDYKFKSIYSITKKNSTLYDISNISVTHNIETSINEHGSNLLERRQQIHMIHLINCIVEYIDAKNNSE